MRLFIICVTMLTSMYAIADVSFDQEVPADLQTQIRGDLDMVYSLQGTTASSTYQSIFQAKTLDGVSLKNFFNQRIEAFGMDDCGGGPSVAACVIPWNSTSKMWVTPNYVKFSAPQLFRISIIFHESRHTETNNGFFSHVNCPTPYKDASGRDIVGIISGRPMAGLPACDDKTNGAYGLQAVLLKNIEHACTNCTEKVRQDGQLFGNDTINRISDLPSRKVLADDLQ